jgi:hypothetical protein
MRKPACLSRNAVSRVGVRSLTGYSVVGVVPPYRVFTHEARDIFSWEYEPPEGDVVFNIGAGMGALLFSPLVGTAGRIIALEAHHIRSSGLVRLCELNNVENVVPLELAASDGEWEC